ncbi:MAG: hypothetical protein ABIH00_01625 [Armatimonadota bacterium]
MRRNFQTLLISALFCLILAGITYTSAVSGTWNVVFVISKLPAEAVSGTILDVKIGDTSFALPAQAGAKKVVQVTYKGADDSQLKAKTNRHIKNLPFSVKLKKGNSVLAERSESYLPCYALNFGTGGQIGFLVVPVYKRGGSSAPSVSKSGTEAPGAGVPGAGVPGAGSASGISEGIGEGSGNVDVSTLPPAGGAELTGIWKPEVGYHWIYQRAGGRKESLWKPADWHMNQLAVAYDLPGIFENKVLRTENLNGKLCWVIESKQTEEQILVKDGVEYPCRKQTLTFLNWIDCKTNKILKSCFEEKTLYSPVPSWLKDYFKPLNSRRETVSTNMNYMAGTMTEREIVYNEDLTTKKKDTAKTVNIRQFGYPDADFTNALNSPLAVGGSYKMFNVSGTANASTPAGLYPCYVLQSGPASIYATQANHFIVKFVIPYRQGQTEERELIYANFNIGQPPAQVAAMEVIELKRCREYYELEDAGRWVNLTYKIKNRGNKYGFVSYDVKLYKKDEPNSTMQVDSGEIKTLSASKTVEKKSKFWLDGDNKKPPGIYVAKVILYDENKNVLDTELVEFQVYTKPELSILEVKLFKDKFFQPEDQVSVVCGVENLGYDGDMKVKSQIEDKDGKIYAEGFAGKKNFYGKQNKEYVSQYESYEHIKIDLPEDIPPGEYRIKTAAYWVKPNARGEEKQDEEMFFPVVVGEILVSDIIPLRGSQRFPFKLKAVYTNKNDMPAKGVTGYVGNTPFTLDAADNADKNLLDGKEYIYKFIPADAGRTFKWGKHEYKANAEVKDKSYTSPSKKFEIGPYEYIEEDETYIKNTYWYKESGKRDKKYDFSGGVNYKGKKYYPVCITRGGSPNGHLWIDENELVLEDENIIKALFVYVVVCGDGSKIPEEIADYNAKVDEDAEAMNDMIDEAKFGKVAELSSNIIGVVFSVETLATGGAGAVAKIGSVLAVIDIVAQTKSSKDILTDLCAMDENSLGNAADVENFQQIEKLQVKSPVNEPFKTGYGEVSLTAGTIKEAAEVIQMYNARQTQLKSFASAFAASQSKALINKAMLKSKMASAGFSMGTAIAAWIESPGDIAPDALYLALCYQKRCILDKKIVEIYKNARDGISRDEEVNDLILLPINKALSASMAAVILEEGASILDKRGKTISGALIRGSLWAAKKAGITDKDYGDRIEEIREEGASMARSLSNMYMDEYEHNDKVISYQLSNAMTRINLGEQLRNTFDRKI